jgi:hypothetical protein
MRGSLPAPVTRGDAEDDNCRIGGVRLCTLPKRTSTALGSVVGERCGGGERYRRRHNRDHRSEAKARVSMRYPLR